QRHAQNRHHHGAVPKFGLANVMPIKCGESRRWGALANAGGAANAAFEKIHHGNRPVEVSRRVSRHDNKTVNQWIFLAANQPKKYCEKNTKFCKKYNKKCC